MKSSEPKKKGKTVTYRLLRKGETVRATDEVETQMRTITGDKNRAENWESVGYWRLTGSKVGVECGFLTNKPFKVRRKVKK